MAGGPSDWTMNIYAGRELRETRGGNWTVSERACRLVRKLGYRQEGTNVTIGFRLCLTLSRRW